MAATLVGDLSKMQRILRNLKGVPKAAVEEAQSIAGDYIDTVRDDTPVDTGDLLDSETVDNTNDGATIKIGGGDVDYAKAVDATQNFTQRADDTILAEAPNRMQERLRDVMKRG